MSSASCATVMSTRALSNSHLYRDYVNLPPPPPYPGTSTSAGSHHHDHSSSNISVGSNGKCYTVGIQITDQSWGGFHKLIYALRQTICALRPTFGKLSTGVKVRRKVQKIGVGSKTVYMYNRPLDSNGGHQFYN